MSKRRLRKSIKSGQKVYLVSLDLHFLVQSWAERHKFNVPSHGFFKKISLELAAELKRIFKEHVRVALIQHRQMRRSIDIKVRELANGTPTISLDRVNVLSPDIFLDATRLEKFTPVIPRPTVPSGPEGEQILLAWEKEIRSRWPDNWAKIGHGYRPGRPSIIRQIEQIEKLDRIVQMKPKEVIVIDDGAWTRRSLYAIECLLASRGIKVKHFIVGLKIENRQAKGQESDDHEEICPLQAKLTAGSGMVFNRSNVVDWVCERDFFPGIDYGGRTMAESSQPIEVDDPIISQHYGHAPDKANYAAPYLLPLGLPNRWASIPLAETKQFSKTCLALTSRLFQAIEEYTSSVTGETRRVRISDLDRIPYGWRDRQLESTVLDAIQHDLRVIDLHP